MAAVPGNLFRRILFWMHLSAGVAAGLIIFVLSATGVLLTYERQMVESAERGNRVEVAGRTPLPADVLAEKVRAAVPEGRDFELVFHADPAEPVRVPQGRGAPLYFDPYTAEAIPDAAAGTRDVLHVIEEWHRWLTGSPRGHLASAVDIANLLFVFIVASGLYLWWPANWRWRSVRDRVLFRRKYVNAKVRDYSWHQVFGLWALIPLFLISLSGVVISYGWASNLVYTAYGELPPSRRPDPPVPEPSPAAVAAAVAAAATPARASLEQLRQVAAREIQDWQTLAIASRIDGPTARLQAVLQSSEFRAPRQAITLSAVDASVVDIEPRPLSASATQTPAGRARTWFRFVHTGEVYGIVGQTIAGLASLAACFLVYTGLALAYRRLLRPLWRKS
ncbi:MAG: hypothetical protein RL026_1455 [Pseudomonadota bacterium]|jgi:uncharacterized iron-regulated membrane protein